VFRNIEIKSNRLSSNVYRLPYVVLGNRGYLIDESSFKRQRHNNKDMISDLPVNVLHHILSFLSTKDAIKTSILATNWRYLWTNLSILHFQMLSTLEHRFNNTLSKSTSLTQLSLQLAKTTLCIPTGIPFPSLKKLNLSYATFANNNSLEQFLSRCPLLQDLSLYYCYLFYINKITIAISTLRILTISFDPYCLNCVDCEKFSVKIDAVNLLCLTCTSDPTIPFVIVNPPTSMLNAYIAFSLHLPFTPFNYWTYLKDEEYVSHCAAVLLSGLASVKSLTLSNGTFMVCIYVCICVSMYVCMYRQMF
jgi:hypothetical protein